jgi:dehydrogenase/reductase SDR family protein 1
MLSMTGRVVLVTGASRGVGRGIARELSEQGAVVYGTGRSILTADLPEAVIRLRCDHTDDAAVAAVFDRIRQEQGSLDVLVNNAWGGYERMVEEGRFTWPMPFWEQPLWRWHSMVTVGVRGLFVASQEAARMMVPRGRGLIVNVSQWAAQKYIGNVIYGVAKAAVDKLTNDMAHELRPRGIAVVSLYPGLVWTEAVAAAGVFDASTAESPEFIGRAVAALVNDPKVLERSGSVVVAAALAQELGFTDVDGRVPQALTLADV